MTSIDTRPAWPIDAMEDKPQGAEGLTYARNLVGRDDLQSWSSSTAEWLDAANGAPASGFPGSRDALVWWREKPQPSDAITDAAAWIRDICRSADGFLTVRLEQRVLDHGAELIAALEAIAEQDGQ